MRWTYPRDEDRRTYSTFCLFPRSFGGLTYWLEWVTVTEVYFGYPCMWVTEKLSPGKQAQQDDKP